MTKNLHFTIVSLVLVISALAFTGVASTTSDRHVRQRAVKARKKVRTVSYVCPMHPDMRSKSRGECPKCGMELVKESRSRDRAVVLLR